MVNRVLANVAASRSGRWIFASKIVFAHRVSFQFLFLCVDLMGFDSGRPCEGAPAARSLTTEYTCGLVWRARNPRAPRQTFAGEILRMRGVGPSGWVCFSVAEEQTAGCVVRTDSGRVCRTCTKNHFRIYPPGYLLPLPRGKHHILTAQRQPT